MSESFTGESEGTELASLSSDQLQVVLAKREHNSHQSVNKLPPELLSRIFRIGEEAERLTRSREGPYLGLQDLATQICSHWRNVAIGEPTLWTFIHITRPPPHELVHVYMSRAGPTTLLDIDIEIRSRFWSNQPCTPQMEDYRIAWLEEIIGMLGRWDVPVERWRSLSVCVKRLEPLIKIIQFLQKASAPSLRFISFKWKIGPHAPGQRREENSVSILDSMLDEEDDMNEGLEKEDLVAGSRLFKRSVPSLSCVDLIHIPWGFFCFPGLYVLPCTGLTTLSLTAAYKWISIPELCNLLSSNPLLESLSLDAGFATIADLRDSQRVSLAALRSFSVGTSTVIPWVLTVLKVIDAPMLHSLTIYTPKPDHMGNMLLANYLSTKQAAGTSGSGLQSIYPSLRELDIASFSCPQSEIANIFATFHSITSLSASAKQVNHLDLLLPQLVTLRLPHTICPNLGDILSRRSDAGLPIKVIALRRDWRMQLEEAKLPNSVRIAICPEPSTAPEGYDSEENEYYSSDEDDDFYESEEFEEQSSAEED